MISIVSANSCNTLSSLASARPEVGHDHVHSFFAELAQLIDKDFLCKLLAGVARSLETEGKS